MAISEVPLGIETGVEANIEAEVPFDPKKAREELIRNERVRVGLHADEIAMQEWDPWARVYEPGKEYISSDILTAVDAGRTALYIWARQDNMPIDIIPVPVDDHEDPDAIAFEHRDNLYRDETARFIGRFVGDEAFEQIDELQTAVGKQRVRKALQKAADKFSEELEQKRAEQANNDKDKNPLQVLADARTHEISQANLRRLKKMSKRGDNKRSA